MTVQEEQAEYIARLEARIAELESAWLVDEHIQADGTLRPSVADTVARVEKAERRGDEANLALSRVLTTLMAAEVRAARLEEVLRMVEWHNFLGGPVCPWCLGVRDFGGHKPDCPRQAVLEGIQPPE